MSCMCIKTVLIAEQEIEKLQNKIKHLEERIEHYKQELYMVYRTSESEASESPNHASHGRYIESKKRNNLFL